MKKKVFTSLLMMAALGVSAAEVTDSSRVVDLDEVYVVSQPKEQFRLRLQPVSSSVLSNREITNLQLFDLRDLSQYVPSFTMPAYGSRYTSAMYVRGIGSRVNSPAVGMYMDNLPIVNKSMHNRHLYQLDRADVLRGPQGTLYGENTEGGLIRLYSKSPLDYQGTDIRLGLGTGFTRNVEISHYNKVSDAVAFSLSAFYDGQKGFFENQATGDRADKMDEGGGRARLLWQPTSRFTLGVLADYQYVSQNGFAYGQLDMESGKAQDPSTNHQGNYKRHMLTTGLTAEYSADWALAAYSASWQWLKDDMLMDIDYLPQDYMHIEQSQLMNAVTQEATLRSLGTGPWHWTFGAFFSHQGLKTNAPVYFDPEMNAFLSKTIEDYAYYGMLNSMAKRMGQEAAAAMIERAGGCHISMEIATIPGLFRTPTNNFGLFHESTIELTNRLTATLGLRYDVSQTSIDYATQASMMLDESVMGTKVKASVRSILASEESQSSGQLLPKVGLSYRIDSRGSNVYATVAKGYRAGGFNIQMFSDILQTELQDKAQTARGDMEIAHDDQAYENIRQTISYKPEESWNYELGTHLNLLGGKLHADLSGFYVQVRNQQLSVMADNFGFGRMMVNAGRSYSCGVEVELRGSAFDNHLQWGASYGYTRAVFKEYVDSVKQDGAMVAVDYKDKRVPFVPEHTFSAMADYTFGLSSTGFLQAIVVGLNVTGQGKTWWDEANTYSQKLYATLGAHADLCAKHVTLSLWGRNLTNTNYNTFAVGSAATSQQRYFAQRANPLHLGFDVRIHF